MKQETLALFKKHLDDEKFDFRKVESGIEVSHDLTDEEIEAIVFAEYGTAVAQSVDALFEVVLKKLVRLGAEHVNN